MLTPSKTLAFDASRTAGLEHLATFLPRAVNYASRRNFDLGPGRHSAVSQLSPYLRHRLLTEEEVLRAVLGRYSLRTVEKFVQEVFWRTYWKGWLEMRPAVWGGYLTGLAQAWDQVQTQSGLRNEWEAACTGQTGIDAFDHWAKELAQTGYLHNHARMWFASIWIFTLRLPWELGADFFLRHLLDGDPASNTLSWRWVAGLQTHGKNYVAVTSNIERYTEGRFAPTGLAPAPAPLQGPEHPPRMTLPMGDPVPMDTPVLMVLHEDDLSPGHLLDAGLTPIATAVLRPGQGLSPLQVSPQVLAFKTAAMQDTVDRWSARLGAVTHCDDASDIEKVAQQVGAKAIVTPYAPVGPTATSLAQIRTMPLSRLMRPYDSTAWPYATAGFFKFKDKIPALVGALQGVTVV